MRLCARPETGAEAPARPHSTAGLSDPPVYYKDMHAPGKQRWVICFAHKLSSSYSTHDCTVTRPGSARGPWAQAVRGVLKKFINSAALSESTLSKPLGIQQVKSCVIYYKQTNCMHRTTNPDGRTRADRQIACRAHRTTCQPSLSSTQLMHVLY